jgi:hypothetical protein
VSADDYHPFIPGPPGSKIAGPTPREHAQARMKSPRAQELFTNWDRLFHAPFRGITTSGQVIPDLYSMQPDGAPPAAPPHQLSSACNGRGKISPTARASGKQPGTERAISVLSAKISPVAGRARRQNEQVDQL